MRIFRTLVLSATALLMSTTAMAQKHNMNDIKDPDAAVEAVKGVIAKYHDKETFNKFLDELGGKFKKSPKFFAGVADAYYRYSGMRDTLNANRYLDKALAINPNYSPAFVQRGDMVFLEEDTLAALGYYNKAINADPTNIQAYDKVIIIERFRDRDKTIALIKSIKEHVPTYPVNLKIADTYVSSSRAADWNMAMEYYQKAERDSMKVRDYQNETSLYNGLVSATDDKLAKYNTYEKMLEVAEEGLQKYPTSFEILNVALLAATNCSNMGPSEKKIEFADKAIDYGERLFAVQGADTLVKAHNYNQYAVALMNRGKYEKAIETYQSLLDNPKTDDDMRSTAIGKIADAYSKMGEYDKADKVYTDYIAQREKDGQLTYFDMQSYAQMLSSKAEESVGQDKIDALLKAANIYDEAARKFVTYAQYAYWNKFNALRDDALGGLEGGKWIPAANDIINLLKAQSQPDETQRYYLKWANYYLAFYYYKIKSNAKLAKPYWVKLYELEPDNQQARSVLEGQYKMKL